MPVMAFTGAHVGQRPGLVFGRPVYTQAEIDAWPSSGAAYTALASSTSGSTTRTILDLGTAITNATERDSQLRPDSVYAKGAACLWAADGNTARRNKVIEVLDSVKNVTSWAFEAGEDNLVAGWVTTNLCQAAAIVGYTDPTFHTFLRNLIWPMLDWPTGVNWHTSFADSRLAIAAYLGDSALWSDAKAYFEFRIRQGLYHSTYDSGLVVPCKNGDWPATATSTTNTTRTIQHWGGAQGAPQVDATLVAEYPSGTAFPDGTNGERTRDLTHVSMGLAGAMHAARTIRAQGDTLSQHVYDRLWAAYQYHGGRVKAYLDTGTIPAPVPVDGASPGGSTEYLHGWYGAARLFAGNVPSNVTALLAMSQVQNANPAGTLHLAAEPFADA